MGFQGDLDSFGLANIFQNLAANQQSGQLHVFDDKTELHLLFAKGSVRSVRPGDREAISVGEILVTRGKISPEELARALEQQHDKKELLGDILVQQGVCTKEEIDAVLRFQMEEEIYDLFFWRDAKFKFDDAFVDTTVIRRDLRIADVRLNTSGLILEALRRLDEWGRLQEIIPTFEIVPVIPAAQRNDPIFAELTEDEKRLVKCIDGVNTIDSITRQSCLGRYATMQFVAKLFQADSAREASSAELAETAGRLATQGELDTAVKLQCRLLDLQPDDVAARQLYAKNLETLDRKEAAAQEYHKLAEGLCGQQDFATALENVNKAIRLDPGNLDGLERAANISLLADNSKGAAALWIKVIRAAEEAGDRGRALEKVTIALTDLPDNADLIKIEARLMIEMGNKTGAIASYEKQAQAFITKQDTASAIVAYRNILRIDSSRNDLEKRIKKLQSGASQQRQEKKGRLVKNAASGVLLLGLALLAGNEIMVNSASGKALASAESLTAKADGVTPLHRVEYLEKALATLNAAKPLFSLFVNTKLNDQREAIAQKLQLARKASAEESARRLEIITNWLAIRENSNAEADRAFAAIKKLSGELPDTAEGKKARSLIEKWQVQKRSVSKELESFLRIVRNSKRSPEERFAAYETILKKDQGATRKKFPAGLQDSTLPVQIEVVSSTGAALRAEVRIANVRTAKFTPCLIEMPCDEKMKVTLYRRGFGQGQAGTPLVRGGRLKKSYRVQLKRSARWQINLGGVISGKPLISADGRVIYAATQSGTIVAVNAKTGRLRWSTKDNPQFPKGVSFREPLQFLGKQVICLDQSGFVGALSAKNGKLRWPSKGSKGALWDRISMSFVVNMTKARPGTLELPGVLVTSRSDSPLYQLEGERGTIRWPTGKSAMRKLRKLIGTPAGRPLILANEKRILVLDTKGRLHVLLPDGTYGMGAQITQGRILGVPVMFATKKGVRIISFVEGKGIYCHAIRSLRKPQAELVWQQPALAAEQLTTPLLRGKKFLIAGVRSGHIAKLSLANGSLDQTFWREKFPRPISGEMVWLNNQLLVPCGKRPAPQLISLRSEAAGKLVRAWQFTAQRDSSISGVAVYTRPKGKGIIVFGNQNWLYCLDAQ